MNRYNLISLFIRIVFSITFGICFMLSRHPLNTFWVGILFSLILNWPLLGVRIIRIHSDYLKVNKIWGIGVSEYYKWNEIKSAAIHESEYKLDRRIIHYRLYLYYKDHTCVKISLTGMFWFERKKLFEEVKKHTRINEQQSPEIPSFQDLM